MSTDETTNHRSRVAAQRREKTRARLLESALLVFAQKGPHAVVEDVIAQAGMARGSFYNYFRTNEELLDAVAAEINDELLRMVDAVVQPFADPAERIACGARLVLYAVERFPLIGTFMARLPFPGAHGSLLALGFVERDVGLGLATGRFRDVSKRVAANVALGIMLGAAHATVCEPMSADYLDGCVRVLMRALGLDHDEAARLAALPLPPFELPATSILRRTDVARP
ncbi:MAG: TetR/AcrR family transcriptional regulator [Telluria sp.]